MVYSSKHIVVEADLDELGHVNNVVYIQLLLEVATLHWDYLTTPELRAKIKWVVRKHEIEYFASAFLGDELEICTWVESAEGVGSVRKYEILVGGKPIVKASTLWIAIHPNSHKPLRISDEIKTAFGLTQT